MQVYLWISTIKKICMEHCLCYNLTTMNKTSANDTQSNQAERTVRDIRLSPNNSRQRRTERRSERRMPDSAESRPTSQRRKGGGLFMLWTSALIILAVLAVIVTFIFIGKTTVDLIVRVAHISTSSNAVYSAYKTPEITELGFTILNTQAEISDTLPATDTKFVEEKTHGKITVYNDYSTKSQRLIKNTRFETPDGKIYRVRNSFTVPGNTKSSSGDTVPGSIEITVYADNPGEEYNKNSATFSIPGLKDDDRYDSFWAESNTALSGGFSGNRAVVSDSNLANKREELRIKLHEQIKSNLQSKITEAQVVFDGSMFIEYESVEKPDASGDNVIITEKATVQTLVFDSTDFAQELANASNISLYEGEKTITNQDDISFSIIQKDNIDPLQDELIQFTVSGDVDLQWTIDIDSLKNDLSGKPSSALDTTLSGYHGVKDAYVTIRPFWRDDFPTNTDNIEINVETQ